MSLPNPGNGSGPLMVPPGTPRPDANTYVFRRNGAAYELTLTSMRRSVIVLFGAGIAWLAGILLLKYRRLRGGAVLLTIVLVAAVAGLWFGNELQLLCQPALLGMLLVAGYGWIDRITRRKQGPAVITVANPSEFVVTSPDAPRISTTAFHEGDEGPTAVRGPEPASDVRRPG